MNEINDERTQSGVYILPKGVSNSGDKVLKLFSKLKRKANAMASKSVSPSSPGGENLPIQDLEQARKASIFRDGFVQIVFRRNQDGYWA